MIHKLSGKSVARALRGYILVEAALSQILLQNLLSKIHELENNTGGTHNRLTYKNEHCMSPWGISYYDELSGNHRNNHGGSSLSDALELCYGPNATIHVLSGKSVARALRGYILVEAALSQILLQNLLSEINEPDNNTDGTHNRLTDKK